MDKIVPLDELIVNGLQFKNFDSLTWEHQNWVHIDDIKTAVQNLQDDESILLDEYIKLKLIHQPIIIMLKRELERNREKHFGKTLMPTNEVKDEC